MDKNYFFSNNKIGGDKLKDNYTELYNLFLNIKKKRWIKSLREGPTGIGYTFESLINKKEDNLREPDFKGIEIKTMKYLTNKTIHLFSMTPNGDMPNPIRTVLEALGYPDKNNNYYKVLNVSITANKYTSLGLYKKLKLEINWKKERIELNAYHTIKGKYYFDISWSFKELKKIYETKINQLAIVKACYKRVKKEDYFYYNKIEFYKQKNFETFIKLIEQGIIKITFKIQCQIDSDNNKKIHDRGTDFSIEYENISLLFEQVK